MTTHYRKLMIELTRVGAIGVALVVLVLLVVTRSEAAFSDTTASAANAFATGTVELGDDDAGSAMFSASGMEPGTPVVACLTITYSGTLTPAGVRMYGSTSGALAPYLDTTIEIGAGGSFGDCTGFAPASTLYSGTLSNFGATHANWATGLATFTASANPTAHTVKFTVDVQSNNAAQGVAAAATFTFEAQS
jgi:hypothetical protein